MACRGSLVQRRASPTSTRSRWKAFLGSRGNCSQPSKHTSELGSRIPDQYTFSQQISLGITNNSGSSAGIPTAPITPTGRWPFCVGLERHGPDQRRRGVLPASSYNTNGISTTSWHGYGHNTVPDSSSFLVPLEAEKVLVPDYIYTFNPTPGCHSRRIQTHTLCPSLPRHYPQTMPHWGMLVTNRLQVIMLETNPTNNLVHVIDYVQLMGPDSGVDLSGAIMSASGYDNYGVGQLGFNGYRRPVGHEPCQYWNGVMISAGIDNQIFVSRGSPPLNSVSEHPFDILEGADRKRCSKPTYRLQELSGIWKQFVNQCNRLPIRPRRFGLQLTQWEANDPLVHYLASDLTDNQQPTAQIYYTAFTSNI